MAGLGVAFISAHAIEAEAQTGGIVILDVGRGDPPVMQAFSSFLGRKGAQLPLTTAPCPEGCRGEARRRDAARAGISIRDHGRVTAWRSSARGH